MQCFKCPVNTTNGVSYMVGQGEGRVPVTVTLCNKHTQKMFRMLGHRVYKTGGGYVVSSVAELRTFFSPLSDDPAVFATVLHARHVKPVRAPEPPSPAPPPAALTLDELKMNEADAEVAARESAAAARKAAAAAAAALALLTAAEQELPKLDDARLAEQQRQADAVELLDALRYRMEASAASVETAMTAMADLNMSISVARARRAEPGAAAEEGVLRNLQTELAQATITYQVREPDR